MISFKHLITTAAAFLGFCHQHLCLICTGITASLLQLGMFYPILLIKCCLCSLWILYWMSKHCLWAVKYFIVSLHLLMSYSFVCDIFTPILYKVFKAWSRPPWGGHHERLYSRRNGYGHLDSQCVRTDWFLVNRPTEQKSWVSRKHRKYDYDYFKHGFRCRGADVTQLPQCVGNKVSECVHSNPGIILTPSTQRWWLNMFFFKKSLRVLNTKSWRQH